MKKYWLTGLVCCIIITGCGNKDEETELQPVEKKQKAVNEKRNDIKLQDGPYKETYPGGQIKMEGTLSAGKKEGEWKSYYESGSPFSVNMFAGGKLNGKTVTYYPNGQIRYIGYYKDGKPSGKWLIFNDKGEKVQEKEYK
jgi:antitoxin component YwqK of YwqJK toxin-antitoxin module